MQDWRIWWKRGKILPTSRHPLGIEVTKAKGPWIWDQDGRKYWDLISGIAVTGMGHLPEKVIQAIQEQLNRYLHVMVWGDFWLEEQGKYARALVQSAGIPPLDTVLFTNSGSEAVDLAIKLARRVSGKAEVIAFESAYHGSTWGAWSLLSSPVYRSASVRSLEPVRILPWNDLHALEQISSATACVIIEWVQGEAGVRTPSPQWMHALVQRTRETGAFLFVDEVQTGFFRASPFSLFLSGREAPIPDGIILGKAVGGGLPLGGLLTRRDLAEHLLANPPFFHITTFGGHPLSCRAGLAHLNLLQQAQKTFRAQVQAWKKYLCDPLQEMGLTIRQAGFMIAIEGTSSEFRNRVITEARKEGILVDAFLWNPRAVRVYPPQCLHEEQIQEVAGILRRVCEQVWKEQSSC